MIWTTLLWVPMSLVPALGVWEWPQGIGLYGLVRLWQHTGDIKLREACAAWMDRRYGVKVNPANPVWKEGMERNYFCRRSEGNLL